MHNNKLILHGSSIYLSSSKNGFAFLAKSGTGKSTHVRMLKKAFKDEINYVNDDKPFLSYENGSFFLYGSPWNGKEHLSNNIKIELKGMFILERSKTNEVSPLSPKDAILGLGKQLHFPKGMEETSKASSILVALAKTIPTYKLKVNMNIEAADVSYKVMKGL